MPIGRVPTPSFKKKKKITSRVFFGLFDQEVTESSIEGSAASQVEYNLIVGWWRGDLKRHKSTGKNLNRKNIFSCFILEGILWVMLQTTGKNLRNPEAISKTLLTTPTKKFELLKHTLYFFKRQCEFIFNPPPPPTKHIKCRQNMGFKGQFVVCLHFKPRASQLFAVTATLEEENIFYLHRPPCPPNCPPREYTMFVKLLQAHLCITL